MKISRLSLIPGLAALAISAPLLPAQINYQGRLTGPAGAPLPDASATVVFNIYAAATGGTPTWGPFTATVPLTDGRFNVILGPNDTNAAPRNITAAFGTGPRFLGIKVGNASEIAPRQQMLAAPEAIHAQRADTVNDGAIGTAQLADLAVTGAKIADGTIPVSKLTGAGATFWGGNATDVWRPGGNVGIGLTAPGAKLDVLGTTKLQGTTTIVNTDGTTGRLQIGGDTSGLGAKSINFGDSDYVRVGEDPADDDALILKGDPIKMIGDVKLGSTSQYSATGGEEILRIVRGWGTANTAAGTDNPPLSGVGAGFTYKKISQGVVDVTFTTPFVGTPCVTANPISSGAIFCQIENLGGGGNPGAAGFRIVLFDTGNNGRDWPFNFIAIGPR